MTREERDKRAEVIADMRGRSMTQRAIAAELGISPGAVYYICVRYGIDDGCRGRAQVRHPVARRGRTTVRRFTEMEDETIVTMSLAGAKNVAIARALGRKPHSVLVRQMIIARHQEMAL
ncbi:helix-turn-helix domain-containing protein [Bradyrhizobium guangdongense]|uniref:helix-turn-helix domain-containing protein n=1 Tax=Bradyrhizobium guangdongense TaxID=1325090 RepID=UPI00131A29CE|nr:helix-turn-helix domain-containing protein [Bradyrhizobium guangdongense]